MLSRNLVLRLDSMKRATRGVDFARNRFFNKGTAFSLAERKHMSLEGLLPPSIETLEDQMDRYWEQISRLDQPINRYQLMRNVLDTNVTLYYSIILNHLTETLPIIYTPTVGEACQKYGDLYQKDHGLYLGIQNIGNIRTLIKNLRKDKIDIIVLTDGSRILGLGDLGVNGIGISIGKTSLYVAAGGTHPSRVLPVVLDVGTNNQELINNPLYLGLRKPRCSDEEFYALLDEFMEAAKEIWPTAVIQFEDFSNNHCFDMLERYQTKYRCFNDDIQGTGAVVAAGFLNAIKLSGTSIKDTRLLFFGAGSAATGVASSITDVLAEEHGVSGEDLRKNIFFVDSKGLVTDSRGDKLAKHKEAWAARGIPAEENANLRTLEDAVRFVKPTALIGLGATCGVFSESIIKFMCTYCERPVVFPLSNPSSKAEILPSNAYKWSNGKAIVASGSPFPETVVNGMRLKPSQGNNLYIFPGVGLACCVAQTPYIPQEVLTTAAVCLSHLTSQSDLDANQLYPSLETIRKVSLDVAVACVEKLQQMGLCRADLPDNRPELKKHIMKEMWNPVYKDESYYLSRNFE